MLPARMEVLTAISVSSNMRLKVEMSLYWLVSNECSGGIKKGRSTRDHAFTGSKSVRVAHPEEDRIPVPSKSRQRRKEAVYDEG